jgi:putative peptidoglycan lipid II flippase
MTRLPAATGYSENQRVRKAAGVVGSATLLSRILGYLRDMLLASYFGAGIQADAFIAAFRIPNILRRLFGEGSLSVAFVPVFTEYLTRKDKQEAYAMAAAAIGLLSMLLTLLTVIGILISPGMVKVIAPGFADSPVKLELTITLTRIMFPYLWFIGMTALCMGFLTSVGHFAAPALAPVFLNLAMIGAVVAISHVSPSSDVRVMGLAFGVLLGGLLQLALQIPFLIQKGIRWSLCIYHPGLKKVGKLMLPTVLGAGAYQINILVGTLLASLLPEGSVSYLYYADRLVQFPLGVFAITMATAVLPSLSRQAAARDMEGLKNTFADALQLISFITLPSMIGLIVLREPIVALLFKRGAFDAETTRLTAEALLYYGIGLWTFSALRILLSTFYALQDTFTPVKTAVISIAANMILGLILMRPLAHGGLALATSLSSFINSGLLVVALRYRIGMIGWRKIGLSMAKSLGCALAMGLALWAARPFLFSRQMGGFLDQALRLTTALTMGTVIFGCLAWFAKIKEAQQIIGSLKRRVTAR